MSTAARKARKRAGIQFSKAPQVPTRPYESARAAKDRRAAERDTPRQLDIRRTILASMNNALRRFRGGAR
ncbi:MAG: hypothetical protein IJO71_09545 [Microbacterium sp.]|uniref:hypothetical protein n=1 Tax=Microbacterium sp. TaxID=51671 RepID=UPI0025DAB6E4|nr:hypothetical protein [Microbacterium sp.]MBQ9917425.1 hypothetical protein [Microbacterium sp.]